MLGVEEAAVGWEEADWLGVEDWVGFLVHAPAGEEECEAWVEEAVVDWVCSVLSVYCAYYRAMYIIPRSIAFGQKRMNSYILLRSSAGKSKKRKGSPGAGDDAREIALDGALEGYLDDTGVETALVAVDE